MLLKDYLCNLAPPPTRNSQRRPNLCGCVPKIQPCSLHVCGRASGWADIRILHMPAGGRPLPNDALENVYLFAHPSVLIPKKQLLKKSSLSWSRPLYLPNYHSSGGTTHEEPLCLDVKLEHTKRLIHGL